MPSIMLPCCWSRKCLYVRIELFTNTADEYTVHTVQWPATCQAAPTSYTQSTEHATRQTSMYSTWTRPTHVRPSTMCPSQPYPSIEGFKPSFLCLNIPFFPFRINNSTNIRIFIPEPTDISNMHSRQKVNRYLIASSINYQDINIHISWPIFGHTS